MLHDCGMKIPYFTCPLYGVGEHNTKIFIFFFYALIRSFCIQPQKISPTFGKLNEIELYLIRSVKFETVQIHFLRELFSL